MATKDCKTSLADRTIDDLIGKGLAFELRRAADILSRDERPLRVVRVEIHPDNGKAEFDFSVGDVSFEVVMSTGRLERACNGGEEHEEKRRARARAREPEPKRGE